MEFLRTTGEKKQTLAARGSWSLPAAYTFRAFLERASE